MDGMLCLVVGALGDVPKKAVAYLPRSLNRVSDPVSRLAKGRISPRARMLYFYGIKENKDHEPSD